MTGVPESAASVARRMRAWQDGHLSGVDSSVLLGAVRDAVNEAAGALRAVREWCDTTEKDTREWMKRHNPECECEVGETYLNAVDQVRALLPPVPEVAEEVEMEDATFTRRDREYPGGTKPSN